MRWSQYFIPTLREDPADAEVVSHKLLLRAGVVRQLAAGIYSYLPLGQRIALKVMQILREEMNAIGGQEFYLPALHPAELWQESGRWQAIGDEMFRLKDRKGTDMCLGMTHEEVFTDIARHEIRSYKQLPQVWYQIQMKFRDEARPKSGLMRIRSFIMKDAYTFDIDQAGLDKSFINQREAYKKIFTRCGIPFLIVEASSGAMGGSESYEFMTRTPAGEDVIDAGEADPAGRHAAAEQREEPRRAVLLEIAEGLELREAGALEPLVGVAVDQLHGKSEPEAPVHARDTRERDWPSPPDSVHFGKHLVKAARELRALPRCPNIWRRSRTSRLLRSRAQ